MALPTANGRIEVIGILTKAFVAKCRSDPSCGHMLQWINIMFRPMDTFGTRSGLGSDVESFPGIPIDSDFSYIYLYLYLKFLMSR